LVFFVFFFFEKDKPVGKEGEGGNPPEKKKCLFPGGFYLKTGIVNTFSFWK